MNYNLAEVTIEITQKCPNSCIFCSSLSKKTSSSLISKENAISVGTQAKKLGLSRISISGGEPLLHPELLEIISKYIEIGLKVNLYTTGIVLDDQLKSKSFDRWDLISKDNVRLIFGIQSTTNSIHDKITRNPGSLQLTKESLFNAIDLGFDTEVHIVPNKTNLFSLEDSVDELSLWGVNQISFLRLVPQGFAKDNPHLLSLNSSESDLLRKILLRLSNRNGDSLTLRIGIPFSGVIDQPKKCNAGETKLIIRFDGKVLPCEAFKDVTCSRFILGDIKFDSLEEIMHKSKINVYLSEIKENISHSETCPAQLLYR